MTAFLSFLNTFAIWFYIAGVLGILFGIKMLFDARRAARTTLFTLEQEQASDRAFRAVLVMSAFTLMIATVAGVNAFVAPAVPAPTPDVIQPTQVAFTPPVILPTATPQPTLTLPPTTVAPTIRATEAPAQSTPTKAPTRAQTAPPAQPTTPAAPSTAEPPQPTAAFIYLAPTLNVPPNNDSIGSNRIRFSWGIDAGGSPEVPAHLSESDRFYRVVVRYTSRTTNELKQRVYCTQENSIDRRTGVDIDDYRTDALDSVFRWNVTVVRAASDAACVAGEVTSLSPTSATSTFYLP